MSAPSWTQLAADRTGQLVSDGAERSAIVTYRRRRQWLDLLRHAVRLADARARLDASLASPDRP